jgi:hypothetical protein
MRREPLGTVVVVVVEEVVVLVDVVVDDMVVVSIAIGPVVVVVGVEPNPAAVNKPTPRRAPATNTMRNLRDPDITQKRKPGWAQ